MKSFVFFYFKFDQRIENYRGTKHQLLNFFVPSHFNEIPWILILGLSIFYDCSDQKLRNFKLLPKRSSIFSYILVPLL